MTSIKKTKTATMKMLKGEKDGFNTKSIVSTSKYTFKTFARFMECMIWVLTPPRSGCDGNFLICLSLSLGTLSNWQLIAVVKYDLMQHKLKALVLVRMCVRTFCETNLIKATTKIERDNTSTGYDVDYSGFLHRIFMNIKQLSISYLYQKKH